MSNDIMKKMFCGLCCLSLVLAVCSCSKVGYLATAVIHPLRPQAIALNKGYKANYYTFTLGDESAIDTYLFFIPGSSHASVQFCRHYLKDLPGNVEVFALQKRHITHWAMGISEASQNFHDTHYFSSWKKDQIDFVNKIITKRKTHPLPQKIVVFGVSEGSVVASAVAARIPQITHLVSFGDGGMKGIDAFRIWGKARNVDFDHLYRTVSKNPSTKMRMGRHSYRWWKEMLEVEPMQYLRPLEMPIFFAMGERDDMVPVASLYYLQEEFRKLEKNNLTVKFYADCDHKLVDSKGKNHRSRFLADIAAWW